MEEKKLVRIIHQVNQVLKASVFAIGILLVIIVYLAGDYFKVDSPYEKQISSSAVNMPEIINGVHAETGLIDDAALDVVIQNCTGCHSAKLIIQTKMHLAGWTSTIKWMQETQNLWDLGENEERILEYLATHYAPTKKGRRANLENIEWYELE